MSRILALVALIPVLLFNAAAHAEGPKTHTVRVVSDHENLRMYFSPKLLMIHPGDTVKWVNEKTEDHNIMTYPDGRPKGSEAISSPFLHKQGDTFSYTFRVEGTYEYHCLPHILMGMHGAIVVGKPSEQDDFHIPTPDEVRTYQAQLLEYFDPDEVNYDPAHGHGKKDLMK